MANEFAAVTVALDRAANGVRLRITDLRSGQSVYLDPMSLEGVVWAAINGRLANALESGVDDLRWSVEPGAEAEG